MLLHMKARAYRITVVDNYSCFYLKSRKSVEGNVKKLCIDFWDAKTFRIPHYFINRKQPPSCRILWSIQNRVVQSMQNHEGDGEKMIGIC